MPLDQSPLGQHIAALIAADGPISVARYMALCLGHPRHGYYMTRDPFGEAGDFVTAPEISQMFGELIGLWCADAWVRMGSPAELRLVELGPGRGTLMADALRAARILPAFRAALRVHLVETSPTLRERQRLALAQAGAPIAWHDDLSDIPPGPALFVANEFFDALPLRQFVLTQKGWCERLVGLGPDGGLAFGLSLEAEPALKAAAPLGSVLEVAEQSTALMRDIASRIVRQGGAMLAIDYGHTRPGFGDTLQAVKAHAFVDVLAEPGEADLTVHVDFAALARAASTKSAAVLGPTTQGAFLSALGLSARADVLKRNASPDRAAAIDAAAQRLAGTQEGGMGELFKVIAVAHPGLAGLAGFDSSPASPDPAA